MRWAFCALVLTGCTQLIVKEPMARFLSPNEEPLQFIGVSDVIEQTYVAPQATATATASNSKVTVPSLGAATKNAYFFAIPSATGSAIGIGARKSLLADESAFAVLVNGDIALGGTEKATDDQQPGVSLISGNIGLSIGWKFHPQWIVYAGGAAQASALRTRYLQPTQCTGAVCNSNKLETETSQFTSTALGLGLDVLLPTQVPRWVAIKAKHTAWADSRTTCNQDWLYEAVFTAPLQ